ncbi:MAG: biotin--[Clostridia bacterium]|nr:biotin--[acetyl-CoA-carboxylase] ligase [Clostridia bacterium]
MHLKTEQLEKYFATSYALSARNISVGVFDKLDSTNSEARRYAATENRNDEVTRVFVALSQSAGRGRMGRSFFSPNSSGLYFTALFDASDMPPERMLCLTPAAAVAVVRVAGRLGVNGAKIKWVNDILIDGKKACGILAESFAVGDKRYAAVGIGINLFTESFPAELESIATSFFDGTVSESQRLTTLAETAELLATELFDLKKMIDAGDLSYMDEYRRASAVIGRPISYVKDGVEHFGYAIGVDDLGRLSVRERSGETSVLSGGEISLFLK